ncbi:MAG: phytoene/squalene synthase family protein [Promethearchaeota archaeon]
MISDYKAHLTELPSQIVTNSTNSYGLSESYDFCMDLFSLHAKSFHFASRYLDSEQRRSTAALYSFCRLADDYADEIDLPKAKLEKELEHLDDIIDRMADGEVFRHPILHAFGDTMIRYEIPARYLHELVEGVRMDVNLTEVKTVKELDSYCYHVASTVGILMCHVWGAEGRETLQRAADLGHAMQITNILRDIKEDYLNQRIYIPAETRKDFRVRKADFEATEPSANLKWLIQHEIGRARSLYARAEIGIRDLPPAPAFTVKVAAKVYSEILNEIEGMNYNVLSRRAMVPKWKKLLIAYRLRREYLREAKDLTSFSKE